MPDPKPVFYASATIVKVSDNAPGTFELDIEVGIGWFASTAIPPGTLLEIRAIANRSGAAEAVFDIVLKSSSDPIKFRVDGDTKLSDERSFC